METIDVVNEKEEMKRLVLSVFMSIGQGFIDSLKTETHKEALDGIDNIDSMSDKEFSNLLLSRMVCVDSYTRSEMERIIVKRIDEWTGKGDLSLSLREEILLDIQSMIKSAKASATHNTAINDINISDLLDNVTPQEPEPLSPIEIRFLNKINQCEVVNPNIPGYFTHEYHLDYSSVIKKLFSFGYLDFAPIAYDLDRLTAPQLKEILKKKGLKSPGKKADLISRVLDNSSPDELEELNVPRHYMVTESGKSLLEANETLIRYFNSISTRGILEPEEVIRAQQEHPGVSSLDILIGLMKSKVEQAPTLSNKRPRLALLRILYLQKHDDVLAEETKQEIERIDIIIDDEREKQSSPRIE